MISYDDDLVIMCGKWDRDDVQDEDLSDDGDGFNIQEDAWGISYGNEVKPSN